MDFEFHPEALAEFREAAEYYESCQSQLGHRFTDSIESGIQQICEEPQRWRVFEGDVRRYLVHVFPYAILFSTEREHILIIAVMHCSREPGSWKSRIK
jgi:toxin ParE1/3/4